MTGSPHPSDAELLRLVDPASDRAASDRAAAHVADCPECQDRSEAFATVLRDAVAALRDDAETPLEAQRLRLADRLSRERTRPPSAAGHMSAIARTVARWSTAAAMVAAIVLTTRALGLRRHSADASPAHTGSYALPDAALTPGAVTDLTADELCRGEHPGVEPAPPTVRHQILRDYRMADVAPQEYELDYLITPELGGANDARNLWPERYTNHVWNAKVKDQLEDLLPTLVCQGRVDLRTAQREIAANWIDAYKKYFNTETPLQRGE